ncbi:hypothetical protein METBIDRAFT_164632 [Metschnikowia bicuspidata var. bicuspidata NRRL YB-4993]|uniref:Uncharacterized protein n=1 Tax=Metschnikowia bicuspidata var. bicuspidata NRRL YB-4993 TaxID=869754 RepID=A0A1A0H9P0_9ASCO|nr:hypothetical protein METBIDRAFT_164632 [Metschnikowia bicuspidata var. bicuspidata NRRL YB-4993]OBA20844.1 hypothetical protein METBIDRAFT_164632 [Metschnikowia bicuspidata var. bicuspidata NRRL YB-4993]
MDEESGDRWHGSDLAKGLRFYQKAFDNYKRATDVGAPGQRDLLLLAYYNALRLLFHVYTQYQRTDGVQLSELPNVAEVLDAGANSVVQEIREIMKTHEASIQFAGADAPTDLLFNTAMVYIDAIEDSESPAESFHLASRAMGLLTEVLQRQVSELQAPASGAKTESADGTEEPPTSASDVIDTVISGFNLAQTLYESVGSSEQDIAAACSLLGTFAVDADQVALGILSQSAEITETHRNEYLISKAYAAAASCVPFEDVVKTWEDSLLPNTPERYMLAADCMDCFMQRSGVCSGPAANPETYWAALSKMNQYLKVAQELLTERLAAARSAAGSSQQMGLGAVISQIAKIHIARSDIDLQRSQLPLEQAEKHQALLANNAKAFLKNPFKRLRFQTKNFGFPVVPSILEYYFPPRAKHRDGSTEVTTVFFYTTSAYCWF